MIPLNVHSYYTFLNGVIPIKALVERAASYNLPALALTDNESTHGHIQFAKECKAAGIKPIFGATLFFGEHADDYIILLAKNNAGYSFLCRLITQKKLSKLLLEHIATRSEWGNLIYLTPNLEYYNKLKVKYKYLEIKLKYAHKQQNYNTLASYYESNIECIISAPIVFLDEGDFVLHKTVSAISNRKTLGSVDETTLADKSNYFIDPRKIKSKFAAFDKYFKNCEIISELCNADLNLGAYKFPKFHSSNPTEHRSVLRSICYDGLKKRYSEIAAEQTKRLEYELDVIDELHFTDYFLIVWDIVREAKMRGMVTIGRGSAANSIVSYCLGITEVDPLKYGLYFERFLNRSRLSPPDIDLDFSWKERDEIIKYVFEKYGYEKVAMISTIVTFRARSAFRETAKVFGLSNEQISKYTKFIPWTSAKNLEQLPELFPESREFDVKSEPLKSIVKIASQLSGFPRHTSIHPSGIVITPDNITNYTALEFAKNKGIGLIVTQPDMYSLEDLGLIKIDLLSQRSLGVLRDTISRINK